jgi:small-conductance mechanosensitive channel
VNRSIWRLFQRNGITIPVAQREIVLHMKHPPSGGIATDL